MKNDITILIAIVQMRSTKSHGVGHIVARRSVVRIVKIHMNVKRMIMNHRKVSSIYD